MPPDQPDSPPACAEPAFPTEKDVEDLLSEFEGDAREAVRALLQDLDTLARDYESSVSRGFVRGALPSLRRA